MEDEDEYAYKKHTGFNSGCDSDSDSKSDFDELYITQKPPALHIEDSKVVKVYPFTLVQKKIKLPKSKLLKCKDKSVRSTKSNTWQIKNSKIKEREELEEFYKYKNDNTTLKDYVSCVLCKFSSTSKKSHKKARDVLTLEKDSNPKGMKKSKYFAKIKKKESENFNVQHSVPINSQVKVSVKENNSLESSHFTKKKGQQLVNKNEPLQYNEALKQSLSPIKSVVPKNQKNVRKVNMEGKMNNLYKSKSLNNIIHTKPIKSCKENHNENTTECPCLKIHSSQKSKKTDKPEKSENENVPVLIQSKQLEKTKNVIGINLEKNQNEAKKYGENKNVCIPLKENKGNNTKKGVIATESFHNSNKSKPLSNMQSKSTNNRKDKNNNTVSSLNKIFRKLNPSEELNTKKSKKKKNKFNQ